MLLRFGAIGSAKIVQASATLAGLSPYSNSQGLVKRATKKLAELDYDPDSGIYLRNRAISALEFHGPNQNFDAAEYNELDKSYASFIGKNISVDHLAGTSIGCVLDSEFIRYSSFRDEIELPLLPVKDTLAVLSERCVKEAFFNHILGFAKNNKLVKTSDRKKLLEDVAGFLTQGAYVENLWFVSKASLEEYQEGLTDAILKCAVDSTSMGMMVQQAICSVCGNVATGELPPEQDFCEHMLPVNKYGRYDEKGNSMKGRQIVIGGMTLIPFEINRDFTFFEDSLILPRKLGGKAGGEGADKDAKLLEVFATKKTAYIEMNPNPPAAVSYNPDKYVMLGDVPEVVTENKNEFNEQKEEYTEEESTKELESGEFPRGTYISCIHEDEKVNAVVIEEIDGGLLVAIDGLDKPVEVSLEGVEVIDYPAEMESEDIQDLEDINNVPDMERHPEARAASFKNCRYQNRF
jgi:hypothetical protein